MSKEFETTITATERALLIQALAIASIAMSDVCDRDHELADHQLAGDITDLLNQWCPDSALIYFAQTECKLKPKIEPRAVFERHGFENKNAWQE